MANAGAIKAGQAYVDIYADGSSLEKGLKQAGTQLKELGRSVTTYLSAPLAGVATAALAFSEKARDAFSRFGDGVQVSLSRVGTDLADALNLDRVLNKALEFIDFLANAFIGLSPPIKGVVVALAGLVAVAGPMLLVIGTLVKTAAVLGLVFSGPIGLAVGIIAATVATVGFISGMDNASTSAQKFGEDMRTVKEKIESAKSRLDELSRTPLDSTRAQLAAVTAQIQAIRDASDGQGLFDQLLDPKAIVKSALEMAGLRTGIQELVKEQERLTKILDGTTEAQQRRILSDNEAIKLIDDLVVKDRVLSKEYELGGQRLDALRSLLDEVTSARSKMLEGMSVEDERIQKATNKINQLATAELLEKTSLDEATAAREAYNKSTLLGGGVNNQQAQLDSQLKTYQEISNFQATHGNLPVEQQTQLNFQLAVTKSNIEGLSTPLQAFIGQLQSIPPLWQQIGTLIGDTVNTITAGIGNMVAQALIYQQNIGKLGLALLKQVGAQVIQTIIQIGIQALIASVATKLAFVSEAASKMAGYAAITYATVYAANAGLPLIGPLIAAGIAAGAVTSMLAGAATSSIAGGAAGIAATAGYEKGGISLSPQLAKVSERGHPELHLTNANIKRHFPELAGRGGGGFHLEVNLDGERILDYVARELPDKLRLHGVTA